MVQKLQKAATSALLNNLNLRDGEKLLVLTDLGKREIGLAFFHAGHEITGTVKLAEIPIPKINGTEPPDYVLEYMLWADVIVAPLSQSISWTRARRKATENGARLASMARITPELMIRSFPLDYRPIKKRVVQLCNLIDKGKTISMTTEKGSNLTFSIDNRMGYGREGGIYNSPGEWGNLPCGEAFVAPVEGTAQGTYIVDASQVGVGLIKRPIKFEVEKGLVKNISGGNEAIQFKRVLEKVRDQKAYTIAEFGIGANHKAKISGITLEDEKVLGTCHIALGNNILFGGNTDVAIHVDGVIRSPTIKIDNKIIMKNGALQVLL